MPRLIATLPVRDEQWILEKSLADLSTYVDEIVALDDGSTDNSLEILKSFPKVTAIHCNPKGTRPFGNGCEANNRNKLLELARICGAEVILQIDADEIFTDSIKTELPKLIAQKASVKFQLCHLYSDIDHFRVDGDWGNFFRYRMYWINRRLRFTPQPIIATPRGFDRKNKTTCFTAKIVHYGWLQQEKHLRRYYEVYRLEHPEKSVSFEEFSSNTEMQTDLRIVKQNDQDIMVKTWTEMMGQESQEKYKL